MNKKYTLTTALGVAALVTPVITVALSNNTRAASVRQVHHDSIWNPVTTLDQNAALNNQDVQDALANQKNYGSYTPWTTQTMLGGSAIKALAPDGHGGFVVGGADGKFDRITASGDLEASWTTKNLLGQKTINVITPVADGFLVAGEAGAFDHVDAQGVSRLTNVKAVLGGKAVNAIIPDGQGDFFVGGENGMLDHLDSQGDVLANWTTKTLLGGNAIKTIVPDGNGGFLVGGESGFLDHVDANGALVAGWTTAMLLGGADINAIVTDGQGNFLVAGQGGKLDKVDATGATVANWTTKDLFNNTDITTLFADGNNGFFATSATGEITHLDANGNVVGGWSDYTLLGGKKVNAFTFDGVGGFFMGGEEGKLDHIDANGLSLKFNSWVVSHDEEEAKYAVYKDMLTKDWSTPVDLGFNVSYVIPTPPDANGNFYVIDSNNKVHLIQNDGTPVAGFTPIALFDSKDDIEFVNAIPDNQGGFVAIGRIGNGDKARQKKLVHVDAKGTSDDWTNKVSNEVSYGFVVVPDGNGGYWVGGNKFSHIDAKGNSLDGGKAITGMDSNYSYVALPDGKGGIFSAGMDGQFGHIDAKGNVTNKLLTNGIDSIYGMAYDNQGGLFVGDSGGNLNHINAQGDSVAGWTSKALLGGGSTIEAITPDGNNGFFIGGENGKLDHINAQGALIANWTTKTLLGGEDIISIVPDGQGEFLVVGEGGKIGHIDADGNSTKPETKEETLARWRKHSVIMVTSDALTASDFSFTNHAGQIWVNSRKSLPDDLAFVYSTDNGQTWEPDANQLHNGQTILVHEQFIDDSNNNYYQLKNNADLSLQVNTSKIDLTDTLSAADFKIDGLRSGATVTFNKPSLSPLLRVEYSVDGGTNWSPTMPVSPDQDDLIQVHLAIKDSDKLNDFNIVNNTPLVLKIDVPTKALNDKVSEKDFTYSKESDGHIHVELKKKISPLLKVIYSIDNGKSWSDTVPQNLKYGDTLTSKLDFKNPSDKVNYELLSTESVVLEINKPESTSAGPLKWWGWLLVGFGGVAVFAGIGLMWKRVNFKSKYKI